MHRLVRQPTTIVTLGHCVDPAEGRQLLDMWNGLPTDPQTGLPTPVPAVRPDPKRTVSAFQPRELPCAVLTAPTIVRVDDFRAADEGDTARLEVYGMPAATPLPVAPRLGDPVTSIGFPGLNIADTDGIDLDALLAGNKALQKPCRTRSPARPPRRAGPGQADLGRHVRRRPHHHERRPTRTGTTGLRPCTPPASSACSTPTPSGSPAPRPSSLGGTCWSAGRWRSGCWPGTPRSRSAVPAPGTSRRCADAPTCSPRRPRGRRRAPATDADTAALALLDHLRTDAVLLRPDRIVAAAADTADLRAWQRRLVTAGIAPTDHEDER